MQCTFPKPVFPFSFHRILFWLCIVKAHSCPFARRNPETSEVQNKMRYKHKAIQNPKTMTLQGPARNTEKDQVSTLWGVQASLGSRVSDFVKLLHEIKYQT